MRRKAVRVAILATLFGLGWALGSAQTSQPEFELIVNAPAGETRIECVRGCDLSWVHRGLNSTATATPTFTFKCTGNNEGRCSSGKVGGWIKQ